MNREILFRGKRTDKDEWIYGYFFRRTLCDGNGEQSYIKFDGNSGFTVIPETIGQFTGLTDKNGTKIFEGDVLTWPNGETGFIAYESAGCQFRIQSEHTTLHIGLNIGEKGQAVVTGNIHDK